MYKFIKKNQKKMLAIFGVLLMIVFIIPPALTGNQSSDDVVVGRIGDEEIRRRDVAQAKAELQTLRRFQLMPLAGLVQRTQPAVQQGISAFLFAPSDTGSAYFSQLQQEGRQAVESVLGPIDDVQQFRQEFLRNQQAFQLLNMISRRGTTLPVELLNQFERHPDLYVVLQREAKLQGIVVTDELVKETRESRMAILGTNVTNQEIESMVNPAIRHWLAVELLFERAVAGVRVTDPEVQLHIAQFEQAIKAKSVSFKASDYLDQVPAPTDEQIRRIHKLYAGEFPRRRERPDALAPVALVATTRPATQPGTQPAGTQPAGTQPITQPVVTGAAATQAAATRPYPGKAPELTVQFGYQMPHRYKLQYVQLPHDQMLDAFLASLNDKAIYELDRAGLRYYAVNQSEFSRFVIPTPEGTEADPGSLILGPPVPPATGPATQPGGDVAPDTRPFGPAPSTQPLGPGTPGGDCDVTPADDTGCEPATAPATAPTTGPTTVAAATQPDTQPATQVAGSTTAPSTQVATTAPTTGPATPTAAAGPTTRPYTEVSGDVRKRLLTGAIRSDRPKVVELRKQFESYRTDLANNLRAKLVEGYQAYAGPTTGPSTLPTTGPTTVAAAAPSTAPTEVAATKPAVPTTQFVGKGAPYEELEYLRKVAKEFAELHRVQPLVHLVADEWKTSGDLPFIPGIGRSAVPKGKPFGMVIAEMAGAELLPTTAPSTRPAKDPELYKPSEVLVDFGGDAFVFRLTAYAPQRAPELDDEYERDEERGRMITVRERIVRDLRKQAAYDAAVAAARAFYDQVQQASGADASVERLAQSAGLTVADIGPAGYLELTVGNLRGFEDPRLANDAGDELIKLWRQATPAAPHPAGKVESPTAEQAVVMQLAEFELPWLADQDAMSRAGIASNMRAVRELQFARDWFAFANVKARTGYGASEQAEEEEPTAPASPPPRQPPLGL